MKKIKTLYDEKMDSSSIECALINIRSIANGYTEHKTNLEKIQAIEDIASEWNRNFINTLSLQNKRKNK